MIKLIACDIDGTLLPKGTGEVSGEILELIRALEKQGRRFVPASGRQYPNLRKLFKTVAGELSYICENGALVIDGEETLFRHQMEHELGQRILTLIMETPKAEALLSGRDTCYIQPKDENYVSHMKEFVGNQVTVVDDILSTKEEYIKVSIYEKAGIDKRFAYWQQCFENDKEVTVVTSGNEWIDIIPKGITKASALAVLGQQFQINPVEMMAIGDNLNDLSMLNYVKVGVAMASGHHEVRKSCKYETKSVEDTLREVLGGVYD